MPLIKNINHKNITLAYNKISPYIHKTPLWDIKIPEYPNKTFFLKLENLQKTGSFKIRGVLTKFFNKSYSYDKTIYAASGGNHGIAVAYASHFLKYSAKIFTPTNLSTQKEKQILQYVPSINKSYRSITHAIREAKAEAINTNNPFFHPFADEDIILGQGTIGLELIEQAPNLDAVIVCIGGGGLIGGVSSYIKQKSPKTKIIGVEPDEAPTLAKSIENGKIFTLESANTIAKTLSLKTTETLNFKLAQKYVDDFVTVTENEIKDASKILWNDYNLCVEYSGATPFAAIVYNKIQLSKFNNVAIITTGSGLDGITL